MFPDPGVQGFPAGNRCPAFLSQGTGLPLSTNPLIMALAISLPQPLNHVYLVVICWFESSSKHKIWQDVIETQASSPGNRSNLQWWCITKNFMSSLPTLSSSADRRYILRIFFKRIIFMKHIMLLRNKGKGSVFG